MGLQPNGVLGHAGPIQAKKAKKTSNHRSDGRMKSEPGREDEGKKRESGRERGGMRKGGYRQRNVTRGER